MRDIRVCVFGDSFVAGVGDPRSVGWVGRLSARSPGGVELTAYPLGVRGESTEEIVVRIPLESAARFARGDDHRIVIAPGVADAVRGVSPAASAVALDFGLVSTSVPALVVGPPPVGDEDLRGRLAAVDEAYAHICGRRSVPYISTFTRLDRRATWHRCRTTDGIHPDGAGYGMLAKIIEPGWHTWLAGTGKPA